MPVKSVGNLSPLKNHQSPYEPNHTPLKCDLSGLITTNYQIEPESFTDQQVDDSAREFPSTPDLIRSALRAQREVSVQKGPRSCLTKLLNGTGSLVRSCDGRVTYQGLLRCTTQSCSFCRNIILSRHRDDLQELLNIAAAGELQILYVVNTMRMRADFDISEGIDTILKSLSLTYHHKFRKKFNCIARVTSLEIVYSDKTSRAWNLHSNSLLFFPRGVKLPRNFKGILFDRFISRVQSIDKKRTPTYEGQYYKKLDREDYERIGNYITKSNSKWNISDEMTGAPYKRIGGLDLTDLVILASKKGGIYLRKYRELAAGISGRRLFNKTRNIREILLNYLSEKDKQLFEDEEEPDGDEPEILGEFSGRLWSIFVRAKIEWKVIKIFNCSNMKVLQDCLLLLMKASTFNDVSFDELKLMTQEIFNSRKYKLIENTIGAI